MVTSSSECRQSKQFVVFCVACFKVDVRKIPQSSRGISQPSIEHVNCCHWNYATDDTWIAIPLFVVIALALLQDTCCRAVGSLNPLMARYKKLIRD